VIYTFDYSGRPVPASRVRVGKGRGYHSGKYAAWKKRAHQLGIAAMNRNGWRRHGKGANLAAYLEIRYDDRRFADIDNLFKAASDPLNRVAYHDDRAISQASIVRVLAPDDPGITFSVVPVESAIIGSRPLPVDLAAAARNIAATIGVPVEDVIVMALEHLLKRSDMVGMEGVQNAQE
jgi:Holliday junction resolvase RusA-like endonuclease